MRWKLIESTDTPTYVIVLDRGDEAAAALATFRRTLEVIARDSPTELRKTHRPELGLALIDLDR